MAGSIRVWLTGLGLHCSLGEDRESIWKALCAGRQGSFGADPICHPPHHLREILGQVAAEAVQDAGLLNWNFDPERAGCVIGLSKGDLQTLALPEGGFDWLSAWPQGGSHEVARRWNLRGPCHSPVAACATGLIAALQGAEWIRRGLADIVLAGAADASRLPLVLGAFRRMGVLARSQHDPQRAVRPWDRDRSGFLVGEGAAVLVLERESHARARGALPYAELCGGAHGADAHHLVELNPDPTNLTRLITRALMDSNVEATEVDHINLHGTATRTNDPLECRALRRAFGPHADTLACSANKPQIGHTLGAAGALELGFTALAVRDGFLPPTLNLDDPDPACDLDATPHVGRSYPVRAAIKLSLGFGGHLAAAVLRRVEPQARSATP